MKTIPGTTKEFTVYDLDPFFAVDTVAFYDFSAALHHRLIAFLAKLPFDIFHSPLVISSFSVAVIVRQSEMLLFLPGNSLVEIPSLLKRFVQSASIRISHGLFGEILASTSMGYASFILRFPFAQASIWYIPYIFDKPRYVTGDCFSFLGIFYSYRCFLFAFSCYLLTSIIINLL